jgi:predicted AlkP superfamily phosphohydrolase/phosphomutase
MGLNGVYVNLENREQGGIVPAADKQLILDRIALRLKALIDPSNGEHVVDEVYFPEVAFRGRNLKYSPDMFVGFRRGYRASWQTALGAIPRDMLEDNTQAWIGDHCMASTRSPVAAEQSQVTAAAPQLCDIDHYLKEFAWPTRAV